MQENYKNAALNRLEEGNKICAAIGVNPKKVLEHGNPKEAICDAAENMEIFFSCLNNAGVPNLSYMMEVSFSPIPMHFNGVPSFV